MKNLRLVEFAVALASQRNFARAAEVMRVTQPTFSRGIAALEKELGARLFDRTTRRVEPTSAGLVFLERADAVLAEAAHLGESIRDHGRLLSGQLVIAAGPYPVELSVVPALARMAARHPALRMRLIEGPWRELLGKLLSGTADLVVMEASILADDHRLQIDLLPRHPGMLFCRPRHPLAGRPNLARQDLGPYPMVGVPMLREVRQRLGRNGGRLDVDRLTGDVIPHIAVTSIASMREIVMRTDGIGLCTRQQIRRELAARRLVGLDVDFELPSTGYGIVTLRGRSLSPAARAIVQILQDVETELQAIENPAVAATPRGGRRRRRA